jgi:plastocyanin
VARSISALNAAGVAVTLLVLVATLATACSSGNPSAKGPGPIAPPSSDTTAAPPSTSGTAAPPSSTSSAPSGPGQVTIKDYDFIPSTIMVKAGTTVTWANTDVADHWVMSAPASPETFDLGRQGTNNPVTHTFAKAGNYPYFCNLHNYMKGTVVVS